MAGFGARAEHWQMFPWEDQERKEADQGHQRAAERSQNLFICGREEPGQERRALRWVWRSSGALLGSPIGQLLIFGVFSFLFSPLI